MGHILFFYPLRPKNEYAQLTALRYGACLHATSNVAYIGFHTRFTPYLPSSVKVLFQTGNTLGFIPQTEPSTTCHPFGDR